MMEPETYTLADDGGGIPNSPLPLLVYRAALLPDPDAMVRTFAAHGWSNAWRDGIFGYHHFHSIAHEVLGIVAGEVRVAFGGLSGREIAVQAGDAVVIPAGVAHRNVGQSPDLLVIGAYPGGSDYDVCRGSLAERETVMQAIAAVPLPDNDPILGHEGGLRRLWNR